MMSQRCVIVARSRFLRASDWNLRPIRFFCAAMLSNSLPCEKKKTGFVDNSRMKRFIALAGLLLAAGCATAPQGHERRANGLPSVSKDKAQASSSAAGRKAAQERMASESSRTADADVPILQTDRFDNLVDRITAGFAMPELDTPLVAQHERWIARNPEYLNRVMDRGGKYLHHIVEELESRGMPTEIALLPIVESAFNPQALSKAKAAGLWQFIPSTGKIFELEQNWWLDERRDVIESTRAALDYLQKLYELQGNDWFLALASYNWGEGAVLRARKRNEASGKPTDYVSLKMPKETSNYVPRLIALRNVLADPSRFGVRVPFIANKPFFVVIDKEQSIDTALAARFAGMSMTEFLELNPSLHRPVINVSRSNRIILPADKAESFQRALQDHIARGEPLVTWKPYTLKPQETLASIAGRSGVSIQDLIRANSLKKNAQPLPGTVLLAPVIAQTDEEPYIETTLAKFTGSRVVEKESLNAIYHRTTKRDTLTKIARRFGVNAEEIRKLNHLEGEVVPGQRLLIRQAKTQTVLTDERGNKQVIAAAAATAAVASAAGTAVKSTAKSAKSSGKTSSGKKTNAAATAKKTTAKAAQPRKEPSSKASSKETVAANP